MISIGRNRRLAPTSTLNVYASVGTHCDRKRSRTVLASRLSRWAFGFAALAAIAALAACGQSGALTGPGSSDSSTAAAKPVVALAPNASSVSMGQSTTLEWSASNAQSCTASGGWSGSQPTSGTRSTGPLTATTTYTLTCTGAGGSGSQSAEVVVTNPAPTVTLAAMPTTVTSGAISNLTWSSTNATACTASGGWSGAVALSGTFKFATTAMSGR